MYGTVILLDREKELAVVRDESGLHPRTKKLMHLYEVSK